MGETAREFGADKHNRFSVDNRAENDDEQAEAEDEKPSSPAETTASVANLRGWLDNFGKKNKEHFQKHQATSATADVKLSPVRRPTVRRSFETGPTPLPGEAANLLARRLTTGKRQPVKRQSVETTPSGVQATNEGYASVAELSKWLADDPTSTKKVRQLRRGANILAKARAFDKGLPNTITAEAKIHRGRVSSAKKRWDHEHAADTKSDVGGPTLAGSNRIPQFVPQYAQSEIGFPRDRSELRGLAKQKWRDRPKEAAPEQKDLLPTVSVDTTKSVSVDGPPSFKSECSLRSQISSSSSRRSSRSPVGSVHVTKPNSPVGFFKAREILVKRSVANGNNMDVIVQRRKAKFESLSKEARRRSTTGHGLLKTSWDSEDGTYVKKYVADIPAKKSFEELP